jgi:hypothetical protein
LRGGVAPAVGHESAHIRGAGLREPSCAIPALHRDDRPDQRDDEEGQEARRDEADGDDRGGHSQRATRWVAPWRAAKRSRTGTQVRRMRVGLTARAVDASRPAEAGCPSVDSSG